MEMAEAVMTSQLIEGRRFSNFEMPDAKIASALNKDHPELLPQEESQSGGSKGPNGRPNSPRKIEHVHDLRILPGNRWSRSCS